MTKYVIGVDEAGRGPIAGPVAVGAAFVPSEFDWSNLSGITDSKKLSEKKREEFFLQAKKLRQANLLDYQVTLIGSAVIDTIGISQSIRRGISRTLRALVTRNDCMEHELIVKLDGALRAPVGYTNQETIVGGDGIEKCIGLASVMAKVTRDHYMIRSARTYPKYAFETHKGYGTKQHYHCIEEYGLCDLHRRSFCTYLQE